MKTSILVLGLALLLIQTSCGPAAENRETMHARAKQIGDSIANSIKASMAEAETPGPAMNAPKADSSTAQPGTQTPHK